MRVIKPKLHDSAYTYSSSRLKRDFLDLWHESKKMNKNLREYHRTNLKPRYDAVLAKHKSYPEDIRQARWEEAGMDELVEEMKDIDYEMESLSFHFARLMTALKGRDIEYLRRRRSALQNVQYKKSSFYSAYEGVEEMMDNAQKMIDVALGCEGA